MLRRCLVNRSAGLTSLLTFVAEIAFVLTFSCNHSVCVSVYTHTLSLSICALA